MGQAFTIVRNLCCGIDVHKSFLEVCVAATDKETNITSYYRNRFTTFKNDLENLANWLRGFSCTDVCMESTGKYWIPVYNVLESHGCDIVLAHPKYTKQLRGKKTDKRDAQWIAKCFMYDLVRGSFIPTKDIRVLRDILRYQYKITFQSVSEKNRFRNCLTVGNIKLDDTFSDVFGVTSMGIIKELMKHPEDGVDVTPFLTASRGRGRLKAKPEAIQAATDGNLEDYDILKMEVILGRIDFNDECKEKLSQIVTKIAEKYKPQLDLLQTIPGVKMHTALVILSEIGPDMSKFASAKSFVSWLGLVPQNNESGGKRRTTRISHAGTYIKPALVQWANAVCKSKKCPEISNYYYKVSKRRGHKKALIALCRKLMVVVYKMLSNMTEYVPEKFSDCAKSTDASHTFNGSVDSAISYLTAMGFKVVDADGVVLNSEEAELARYQALHEDEELDVVSEDDPLPF